MNQIHVEATDVMNARPEVIYGILSDYRVGHPAIVPKPYFTEVVAIEGGQGAGTRIRITMKVMGVERVLVHIVSEPEPGRVLMERDENIVTTFIVDPINGGQQSRVTISTDMNTGTGVAGFMEKLINPPVMRHIFKKELRLIADYAVRQNN